MQDQKKRMRGGAFPMKPAESAGERNLGEEGETHKEDAKILEELDQTSLHGKTQWNLERRTRAPKGAVGSKGRTRGEERRASRKKALRNDFRRGRGEIIRTLSGKG